MTYAISLRNMKIYAGSFQQTADELFECVWPFCEVGA